jgi:CheY-like chemotaxis protein
MTRVLVLDDQPAWRNLIVASLKEHGLAGAELLECGTYEEAVELAAGGPLDGAVLDHGLASETGQGSAEKSGMDVARRIRELHPDAVILLATVAKPGPLHLRDACAELSVALVEKSQGLLASELVRELREAGIE